MRLFRIQPINPIHMKTRYAIFLCLLLLLANCKNPTPTTKKTTPTPAQMVFTADVENFWVAHDKIRATKDASKHLRILHEEFLDKGTPGLTAIMQARRYRPQEYVDMINNYPKLWKSIREQTFLYKGLSQDIDGGIERLKAIYPDLKPAQVYFTIGVFRTGGTTMDNKVLIGVETGFGDKHVDVSELPDSLDYIKRFWAAKDKPVDNFALTNVHEYVHTQQRQNLEANLLGVCVFEGIAEFVSTLAMGLDISPAPAVHYGKQNAKAVRDAFEKDLFSHDYGFWVWSDANNKFNTRDLGYYIGYEMAEKYYAKAENKKTAIKEMIELDLYNLADIEAFATESGFFDKSIDELKANYAKLQE